MREYTLRLGVELRREVGLRLENVEVARLEASLCPEVGLRGNVILIRNIGLRREVILRLEASLKTGLMLDASLQSDAWLMV